MTKNCKWQMVLLNKRNNNFHPFSQFASSKVFSPNLPIAGLNNELHNLESKGLENDGSKGQLHFACLKHY